MGHLVVQRMVTHSPHENGQLNVKHFTEDMAHKLVVVQSHFKYHLRTVHT